MPQPRRGAEENRRRRGHAQDEGVDDQFCDAWALLAKHFSFDAHSSSQGEAGTGNIVEAVRHARCVQAEIRRLQTMSDDEVYRFARDISAPLHLVQEVKRLGRLPVVNFAAGGIATPADAALMMQLGMDGVFVGSGIFKSEDPAKRARAIVQAVAHYDDAKLLMEVSRGLGQAMVGVQDLRRDPVNFREREAGEVHADGKPIQSTDAHLHGSSWSASG